MSLQRHGTITFDEAFIAGLLFINPNDETIDVSVWLAFVPAAYRRDAIHQVVLASEGISGEPLTTRLVAQFVRNLAFRLDALVPRQLDGTPRS